MGRSREQAAVLEWLPVLSLASVLCLPLQKRPWDPESDFWEATTPRAVRSDTALPNAEKGESCGVARMLQQFRGWCAASLEAWWRCREKTRSFRQVSESSVPWVHILWYSWYHSGLKKQVAKDCMHRLLMMAGETGGCWPGWELMVTSSGFWSSSCPCFLPTVRAGGWSAWEACLLPVVWISEQAFVITPYT